MRTILFRGKSSVTKEWVYGYLLKTVVGEKGIDVIVPHGAIINDLLLKENIYQVDPETLGQYTGLKDNNGNRIFEGDIVKYADETFLVVFEQRNGSAYFGIKISNIETWNFSGSVPSSKMEVVGNIHDNPELLEMKE